MHQAFDLPSDLRLQGERHRMHGLHVLLPVLQQGDREALPGDSWVEGHPPPLF